MGVKTLPKYTSSSDQAVTARVEAAIEKVRDEIAARLKPDSIILIGSFGRGEALVSLEGDSLKFLSDCDIIVISRKLITRKTLIKLEDKLKRKTSLEVNISGLELSLYFNLAKFFTKIWRPTIDVYDMKYGSRIVYGQNYLERIPDFKPEEIPVWEGVRLVFNRMIESLACLEHSYLLEQPNKEDGQRLLAAAAKMLQACRTALLILNGQYHHQQEVRKQRFEESFSEYSMEIESLDSRNPLRYWFAAAALTDKILRHILNEDAGLTFRGYDDFYAKFMSSAHIRNRYHRGLSASPLYQNSRSTAKVAFTGRGLPPPGRLLWPRDSWSSIIYATIPLIYFALNEDGSINSALLKKARQNLSLFARLEKEKSDGLLEWRYLKDEALKLRDSYCH